MAEEEPLSATAPREQRRLTVQIDHSTDDYNCENSGLPWYTRLVGRNWLTISYSIPPSIVSVLLFLGANAAVGAVSGAPPSDPGVRVGAWFIVATIGTEVGVDIMRTDIDPTYIQRKPLYWVTLAVAWSASLVISGGNLGMWAFAVWWLQWCVSILVSDVVQVERPVLDALRNATMFSTVFLLIAASVSGYIYVLSTVSGVAQVTLTGCVYPTISWGLKEVLFKVVSEENDKDAGLSENDDVESGTFITIVVFTEALLELANKVAIARITSTYGFAGTMALSFVIEVMGKAAVLWWHRNKMVAEQVVTKRTMTGSTISPETTSNESPSRRTESLKKAAHRHENANDKKRYEFRTYYEEFGESIATIVAFGTLIVKGELQPADGLARLAFALSCEYFADLGVWVMMESDGYNLTNVVYRFSPARIATPVSMVVVALAGVEIGNEMVAMALVNVVVNGTVGNSTSNGTMNATL